MNSSGISAYIGHFGPVTEISDMNKITVLSLISFDHAMLLDGIAKYIDIVDEVILGLDANRTTFAGQKFDVPESFFAALKALDKANKIKIVEESFFQKDVEPLQNFTRIKNILSSKALPDSWLVSIDPDEVIVNLVEFIEFLQTFNATNTAIFGKQVVVLKIDGDTTFVVENDDWSKDDLPLATRKRNGYTVNRHTDESIAFAPVCSINNSWGRSEEAVDLKLHHVPFFAKVGFKKFLADLNPSNYFECKGFNPFGAELWERVDMVEGDIVAYANKRLDAMRHTLAWSAVTLGARANLFEGKVVGRGANIAELKQQHKTEVEKLKSEYEARFLAQTRSYKELKMQLDAELLAAKARRDR